MDLDTPPPRSVETQWPIRIGTPPPLALHRVARSVGGAQIGELGDDQEEGCWVLTGMGGVGKTQVAAQLAEEMWQNSKVDLLLWTSASNRNTVINAFARAARILGLPCAADHLEAAEDFLSWLAAPRDGKRWLVVLDDLASPSDIQGLWPPKSPLGRSIVTTRRRDAAINGKGRKIQEIPLYTPEKALDYLEMSLGPEMELLDASVAALVEDLGYLPLALAHAAAYMKEVRMTCSEYRQCFTDQRIELEGLAPPVLPDEYNSTVGATWELSITAADLLRPTSLSRPLLDLASLLDSGGIPTIALTQPIIGTYLSSFGDDQPVSVSDIRGALSNLHRFHLIDYARDTVWIHSLVQRSIRERLNPHLLNHLVRTNADAIAAIWAQSHDDRRLKQSLERNARTLHEHSHDTLLHPTVHEIIYLIGQELGITGRPRSAVIYFKRLAKQRAKDFGNYDPDVLSLKHNTAYFTGVSGDSLAAVEQFKALLPDYLQVHGAGHNDLFAVRTNIARFLGESGQPRLASNACKEILTDRLKYVAHDHVSTFVTRHDLAFFTGESGDPHGAVRLYEALLRDRSNVLGPGHQHTLQTRLNLARFRGESGDAMKAIQELEVLVGDYRELHGTDWPGTLLSRIQLARFQAEISNPEAAIARLYQAYSDCARTLEPNHKHALTALQYMAEIQEAQGVAKSAIRTYTILYQRQMTTLGMSHPKTERTRQAIARCRNIHSPGSTLEL